MPFTKVGTDITLAGIFREYSSFLALSDTQHRCWKSNRSNHTKKGADILKRIGASMAEATERMEKSPSLSLFGAGDAKTHTS